MNNEITKFEVGKTYTAHSICDYDCIYRGKVIKRTASTVTFDCGRLEIRTVRINAKLTGWNNGVESVYPFGRYSMCPTFHANEFEA